MKVFKKMQLAGVVLIVAYTAAKITAEKRSEDNRFSFRTVSNADAADKGNGRENSAEINVDSRNIYKSAVKPAFDRMFSFFGLLLLSPVFLIISIAIVLDDPGPVFFTQKRIGKDKTYFMCHKFRSMKMSAPANVPTHLLSDPDQYITGVGRVLRKTSLDELPQLWDIFRGKMSVIGPRPALWNQDDLISCRSCVQVHGGETVDVNKVLPGLTGLAQICGRDRLEIVDKAELDGKYVEALRAGGLKALIMDCRCFFGTIGSVMRQDGVVEGGTGEMKRMEQR